MLGHFLWNPDMVRITSPDGARVELVLPERSWTVIETDMLSCLETLATNERLSSQAETPPLLKTLCELVSAEFLVPADDRAFEAAAAIRKRLPTPHVPPPPTREKAVLVYVATGCNLKCPYCCFAAGERDELPFTR